MPVTTPPRLSGRDGSIAPRTSLLLLALVALAMCVWILRLPLFPTQDGPMHLYFVRLLEALLFGHDPGIFPHFYTVKHVLPPYSLYYYALIALHTVCPLPRADQFIICAYVVLFLFGFRSLATAFGPAGNSLALLAAPLVLSWPLGMGFVNFCLSLSLALWALSFWCRAAQLPGNQTARLAGFVVLCLVMLLTHPVPLLVTLLITALELAMRWRQRRRGAPLRTGAATVALALSATSLGYLLRFKGEHSLAQHKDYASYHALVGANLRSFYLLRTLTLFAGHSWANTLYKVAILLIPLAALAIFWSGRAQKADREYRFMLANLFMAFGLVLAVVLPLLPPDLNNSHYFTARLVVLIWLTLLAGASATSLQRLPVWALPAAGLALSACTLTFASMRVNPIAREIAQQETAPTGLHENVVLFLHSTAYRKGDRLSYDPYYWSPVRLLRRSGSVMFNTPWLDLQIIPIGAQPVMPTGHIDSYALEDVPNLRRDLERSAADRAFLAAQTNAVLINDGVDSAAGSITTSDSADPLLSLDATHRSTWNCTPHALTQVCLPER